MEFAIQSRARGLMHFRRVDGNVAAMDKRLPHGRNLALVVVLAAVPIAASAAGLFIVTEPWVRVAPNARSAEAYMQLKSTEGATVVGVRSDVAANVTLRPPGETRATASAIRLPAGVTVMLAPGAYRLVIPTLDRALKLGDRVPFVLTIETADGSRQEIPVDAEVRKRSPTDDHKIPHRHS